MIRAKLNNDGRLTEKQIVKIVDDYKKDYVMTYKEEEKYYDGQNPTIKEHGVDRFQTSKKDSTAPNWKINVAYGRKIIRTITGYAYKPGNINYQFENESDEEIVKEIYKANNEDVLNQILGTYQGTNGKVYELHLLTPDNINETTDYKITYLKAADGIAIYNHDIIPEMVAFIRMYIIDEYEWYDVYYNTETLTYKRKYKNNNTLGVDLKKTPDIELVEENTNLFQEIPVIETQNNVNYISDISVIREMIDAYDNIMSGGMVEFSRFAFAYLRLVGMSLDPKDKDKLKELRIFEGLENKDAVTFLTKDIPTEFLEKMADRLKSEIHRQSFIPDIDDIQFSGSASGVAIDKFIYLMEFAVVDKEAYFRKTLRKRLQLISQIKPLADIDNIKITFNRNLPFDDLQKAMVFEKLDGRGLSREWLITHYTKAEDAKVEMEKADEEAKERRANMPTIFDEDLGDEENDNTREESQTNRNVSQ